MMQQNNIKSLPVVDSNGDLVGIVTRSDMLRAEPSPVTTLSVFEMASLLEKVTMDKIMSRPVFAVDESCSITNAANFMLSKDVGCLPVIHQANFGDNYRYRYIQNIRGGYRWRTSWIQN